MGEYTAVCVEQMVSRIVRRRETTRCRGKVLTYRSFTIAQVFEPHGVDARSYLHLPSSSSVPTTELGSWANTDCGPLIVSKRVQSHDRDAAVGGHHVRCGRGTTNTVPKAASTSRRPIAIQVANFSRRPGLKMLNDLVVRVVLLIKLIHGIDRSGKGG